MPLARIRTQFPEEVVDLAEALIEAGYTVETVRLDEFRIAPADIEFTVDKLPVVEAWRRVPDVDQVFVVPGTPESHDIRSHAGREMSHEPFAGRLVIEIGEFAAGTSRKLALLWRETRGRIHEIRERWTPPREYNAPVHLEPVAPANVDTQITAAVERMERERREQQRRREAAERQRAEQLRITSENRQRAREAAEAKALLEEQQKIEAMVRATETMRQNVLKPVAAEPPTPRKRPRRLLRTRRERAFVRAGVAAFTLSVGMATLAGQALHRKPASVVLPASASVSPAPFAKNATPAPVQVEALAPSPKPSALVHPFTTTAIVAAGVSDEREVHAKREATIIADDEVIIRKPAMARTQKPRAKDHVIHYSDLD